VATFNIIWNWGTNSNIDFNPATDILDFGWLQPASSPSAR